MPKQPIEDGGLDFRSTPPPCAHGEHDPAQMCGILLYLWDERDALVMRLEELEARLDAHHAIELGEASEVLRRLEGDRRDLEGLKLSVKQAAEASAEFAEVASRLLHRAGPPRDA